MQRIFSVIHRAKNEVQLIENLSTGMVCRVKSEPVKIESGTNILILIKHEMNTEDLPSFSSVFFTRIPGCPAQRPDAGAVPVNPPDLVNGQKSVPVP